MACPRRRWRRRSEPPQQRPSAPKFGAGYRGNSPTRRDSTRERVLASDRQEPAAGVRKRIHGPNGTHIPRAVGPDPNTARLDETDASHLDDVRPARARCASIRPGVGSQFSRRAQSRECRAARLIDVPCNTPGTCVRPPPMPGRDLPLCSTRGPQQNLGHALRSRPYGMLSVRFPRRIFVRTRTTGPLARRQKEGEGKRKLLVPNPVWFRSIFPPADLGCGRKKEFEALAANYGREPCRNFAPERWTLSNPCSSSPRWSVFPGKSPPMGDAKNREPVGPWDTHQRPTSQKQIDAILRAHGASDRAAGLAQD